MFSNVSFGSMDGGEDLGLMVDMTGEANTEHMPLLNEFETNSIEGFGAAAATRAPAKQESAGSAFMKELGKGSLEVGKAVLLDKYTKKAPAPVNTTIINQGMNKKVLWLGGGALALAAAYYFYNRSSNPSAVVS